MHIVDLQSCLSDHDSLSEFLQSTDGLWSTIYEEMSPEDTLWVFAPNQYQNREFWPVGMATADYARDESELVLKNIITRHKHPKDGGDMRDVYEEILFLVKDKRAYRFDKDPIRVSHVYQGNEWGEDRETGKSAYHETEVRRYNPNGKDPGNVWLDEVRDETPNEEIDETLPLPRIECLRRCLRAGSEEEEEVHGWCLSGELSDAIEEENRLPITRELTDIKT